MYLYYILKKTWTTDKEGLKEGVRISKIPGELVFTGTQFLEFDYGNGPYDSLESLKKESTIFKELAKSDSKRASQILEEKNISIVKELVKTHPSQEYPIEFVDLIDHSIRGRIKNGKLSGIHFYDKDKIKIIKKTDSNEKGVWKAKFKFRHPKTNLWIEKNEETTFFPKNWDIDKLFHELYHAFLTKKKIYDTQHIFESETLSGIKVKIVEKNGILKSIYPII